DDAVVAAAGDDVARRRRGAADEVVVLRDFHAVPAVADRSGAGGIGADVVALHGVVAAAGGDHQHAVVLVARDDVAAAADPAADDLVVARSLVDEDPAAGEVVDDEPFDGHAAAGDLQPVHPARAAAVELDDRLAGKPRLRGRVKQGRLGNAGEAALGGDG